MSLFFLANTSVCPRSAIQGSTLTHGTQTCQWYCRRLLAQPKAYYAVNIRLMLQRRPKDRVSSSSLVALLGHSRFEQNLTRSHLDSRVGGGRWVAFSDRRNHNNLFYAPQLRSSLINSQFVSLTLPFSLSLLLFRTLH